jgi:hypothetical protein
LCYFRPGPQELRQRLQITNLSDASGSSQLSEFDRKIDDKNR